MSNTIVYEQVYEQVYAELDRGLDPRVDRSSRERLALVVSGLIEARDAAPARIAAAIHKLGLSAARIESIERRVRRMENDPELDATGCVHPFARQQLARGGPKALVLILDATTQDERVVLLTAAVWYRGRALPLAWAAWPANTPLVGARFWERVAQLLAQVAPLLPGGVPVTWLADRAFGTPHFTDLLAPYGWHYVVRVQGQTRFQDRTGRVQTLRQWVARRGQRFKGQGQVFKKQGWRCASVVLAWGARHTGPVCLVSDLPPEWDLLRLYQKRYPIEGSFRDYKSHGWDWERGQVVELAHIERLLVAMALASWLVLLVGTQMAAECLRQSPTGRRHTCPYAAKRSLFTLGLQHFARYLTQTPAPIWQLSDWDARHWQAQLHQHHARAFVFALPTPVRP
jgi:hypothetical protein